MKSGWKLLYTKAEVAEILRISISTLDVMIRNGILKTARKGRRPILIHADEIERVALLDIPRVWPEKVDGKTTRQLYLSPQGSSRRIA